MLRALARLLMPLIWLAAAALAPGPAGAAPVRIGVLAFRPKPQTLARWQPLAGALRRALPDREFVVEPLTYSELDAAIAARRLDFILTNPGHYVQIRRLYGLSSPLATLAEDEGGWRASVFGGVIFTRADLAIGGLGELKGRRIAFPDTESLGGYQMQAYELSRAGVRLPRDATLVPTGMPHDNVVEAVLAGRADAGFVRTGTLEAMVREGKLDLGRIRIVHRQRPEGYPDLVSTRLYPDWPFIAAPGVDERTAREVAAALFQLEPDGGAARAMKIQGFSVPADYSPVEDILRELRLPPFDAPPRFTLRDVWARYRWPAGAFLALLGAALLLAFRLQLAHRAVRREHGKALRHQHDLLASQELFAKAFALSPDAIAIARLEDGVYLAVNEGFTRITGYSAGEIVGQSSVGPALSLWADPADRQRLVDGLRATGEVDSLESQFRMKDGHLVTGQISARVLEIDGEHEALSITRDVTALRRMERERADLQSQLLQSQKMESLGILAGGVAHDMNNVLAAILGLASAHIPAQSPGSAAHEAFGTIIKAAERGGRMITSLLSFARQRPAELRALDLNGLLREQVQLLRHTTLAKVRLDLDLEPGLRPIQGEAGTLAHALMNLCVNAVEAMTEQGTLTLRSRNLEAGWVEVQVEDTGAGMSREILDKAVDPFFTTKEPGKGTGLGLAMVYSAVKAHQGRLELHSEAGRGTRVVLRFPACAAGPGDAGPGAQPAQPPLRGRKVLLVDDDEMIQWSMKALLEVLGHATTIAGSGEAALELLAAGYRPEVVVLDMNMPGLGGAATLPRLRVLCPAVPVLLATGRADQAALDLVAAHAHVRLLPKPFTMDEFDQSLAELAGGGT